jgi:glycosyltransferase involved in cell wall biosynthesis
VTTLSLAMIVKDEAETIERALEGPLTFVDEAIVVDTGSSDATVSILESYEQVEVHHFPWIDDFSAAFNFAFANCSGDWIFYLHADDVIREVDLPELKAIKEQTLSDELDAVLLDYNYIYNDNGTVHAKATRPNFLRRHAGLRWEGSVHERITPMPRRVLARRDITLEHRPTEQQMSRKVTRNLDILRRALESGDADPRTRYFYAGEFMNHERYEEAIEHFQRYLELGGPAEETYHALMCIGRAHRSLGRCAAAEEWLKRAIELLPERAEAWNYLGKLYYYEGRFGDAIPVFARSRNLPRPSDYGRLSLDDYTWVPGLYLSDCLARVGRGPEALHVASTVPADCPQRDWLEGRMRTLRAASR